jgi:DnaJ-domain-containing protein 1
MVDQIFDRLEMLVRAWMSSAFGEGLGHTNYQDARAFEDQDMADAWDELESYLDPSKTESERKAGSQRRASSHRHSYGTQNYDEDIERRAVEDAYRFLGLEPYTSFSMVKARYKELLKKHHPDRHTDSPENMQKATVVSAKINTAYQLIETWEESRMEHPNGK